MQEYSLIYEKLKMEELIKEISKIVDNDSDENKINLKINNLFDIVMRQFQAIEKVYLKSQKEMYLNQFKLILSNLFSVSINDFFNSLDIATENKLLNKELNKYFSIFSNYSEYVKFSIFLTFAKAKETIKFYDNPVDFKKIYIYYEAMIIGILNMLPESYRNILLDSKIFESEKKLVDEISFDYKFEINDIQKFYELIIENDLRDYVEEISLNNIDKENQALNKKRV